MAVSPSGATVDLRARVARIFDGAPFVSDLGLVLVDAGEGWCETRLPLTLRHRQHGGVAHAGVISTLADHTAGAAAQTVCEPGQTVVTAEFKINLLRPGQGEQLWCRAEVLKRGRSFHVVEAEVFGLRDVAGAQTRVRVAKFNGTLAVVPGDF